MRLKRLLQYIPITMAIILINIVTVIIVNQLDSEYYKAKQAESIVQTETIARFEVESSDILLNRIQANKQNLPDVTFVVEYYQNIPDNPLNQVYIIWNQKDQEIPLPIRHIIKPTEIANRNRSYVGNKVWYNLSTENKKGLSINTKEFSIAGIAGEKGVNYGLFDESIIIFGEMIDSEYTSRIPQNYAGSLYIMSQNTEIINQFQNVLSIASAAEITASLAYSDYADKYLQNESAFSGFVLRQVMPLYIIVAITVGIMTYFLIEQQRYKFLVMKVVGATNREILKQIIIIICILYFLIMSITIGIQRGSVIFDLPFLAKIRNNFYGILFFQTAFFIAIYTIFTMIGVYKNQPANFLKEKK
ncbi:MAG: hypothetical protein ACRC6X_02965 [Culicoidibacterales bacterium]